MQTLPPYDKIGVQPPPPFVNANPSSGIAGSIVNAEVFNALQEEITNAQTGAGLSQNPNDYTQLNQTIRSGLSQYYVDAGGVNTPSITPANPAVGALVDGMFFRVKMAHAPTGASELAVNTLTAPIVRRGAVAMTGGEWAAGDIIDLVYSSDLGAFEICGLTISDILSLANPNATVAFFVNGATGNDSNNGLTTGTAFATIQGAVNAIQARYISLGMATVNVAAGTYSGFTIGSSGIANWNITGASAGTCTINASTSAINQGTGALISQASVTITNFTFGATLDANVNANSSSSVVLSNCNFTAPTAGTTPSVGAYHGSTAQLLGTLGYSGSGQSFISAALGAVLSFGYKDNVTTDPVSLTISGTPTFSAAFALAMQGGIIAFYPTVSTFSGSANGPRYSAISTGLIDTQGSGAGYLPGNSAGSTATGGQYV